MTRELMPISIRTHDTWSKSHNSLKRHQLWRIVPKPQWRLIRTEVVGSSSYADASKHC